MIDGFGLIIIIISLFPVLVLRFSGSFVIFALLAIVAISIHGIYLFGSQILLLLSITFAVSTVAELISLKTPFGIFGAKYKYNIHHKFFSSRIWLLGVYPLEISLAWVILKYLSYSLAMLIAQAFGLPYPAVIFGTPLILLSLDLILDPVAVNIKKHWTWEKGSAYFGIPLRNFLGWYAVGLVGTLLFSLFDHPKGITFNILYLLPIMFYGSFIKNSFLLFRLNKKMAIVGAFPAIFWTILSTISLIILFIRQA
ncbi:MAG: carotenoid biosynthesis protein [Candidatus Gottesmanbacteria bacterium]|nr:carotenoid biosynthesis protein [Candidatus Gottesmanbacteria bacterium]